MMINDDMMINIIVFTMSLQNFFRPFSAFSLDTNKYPKRTIILFHEKKMLSNGSIWKIKIPTSAIPIYSRKIIRIL